MSIDTKWQDKIWKRTRLPLIIFLIIFLIVVIPTYAIFYLNPHRFVLIPILNVAVLPSWIWLLVRIWSYPAEEYPESITTYKLYTTFLAFLPLAVIEMLISAIFFYPIPHSFDTIVTIILILVFILPFIGIVVTKIRGMYLESRRAGSRRHFR